MTDAERAAFEKLVDVCRRLRGPDGCPWDREQTLESMTPYLAEEAFEAIDAIGSGDLDHAGEELGDLGFLVIFCLELLGERSGPGLGEAFERAAAKLIRRHPHVYGDARVSDGTAAYKQWQEIKQAEKAGSGPPASLLGDSPKGLPALVAAYRLQEKAAAVGFDWPSTAGPLGKIREETAEVEHSLAAGPAGPETAAEIGDLLFAVVNLARHLVTDPERELRAASGRFRERFLHVERRLAETGRAPSQSTLEEMNGFWEEAKRLARNAPLTPEPGEKA